MTYADFRAKTYDYNSKWSVPTEWSEVQCNAGRKSAWLERNMQDPHDSDTLGPRVRRAGDDKG